MEYDEEHMANPAAAAAAAGLKKTPSEASFASIELHLPRRRGDGGGAGGGGGGNAGAGPGVTVDKECLSMKSDCGMDIRRRFSLVNAAGKKVRPHRCNVRPLAEVSSVGFVGCTRSCIEQIHDKFAGDRTG